jgi:hypothetical protein
MPHATRTMPHFLVAVSLTIAVALTEPRIQANERIHTLGKDKLGEAVKEFRIRYPKTKCGRVTSMEITPETLIDPGSSNDIHCCLNDKESLSKVSRFPIVNLDGCAVHAIFWKNRLCDLSYILDVRSVQIVLDDFEKHYGRPTRALKDPEDPTKLIFVDWMKGMTNLKLQLCRLGGEDSTRLKGAPWLEVVSVSLWNSALGTA